MRTSRIRIAALAGTFGSMVACTPRALVVAGQNPLGPAATLGQPYHEGTTSTIGGASWASLAPGRGIVRLDIRWPRRPAFATQTIPDSANSLEIQIADAGGGLLASTLLVRPSAGTLQTTASLVVPAGTQRLITIDAYTEQSPGVGSVPIAAGTASIDVASSTVAGAVLDLVPAFPPTIASMTPNGGPGAYVTLTGQNFSGDGGPIYVVFATGATSSCLVTSTATELEAAVPAGANDGPVSVWADGITGESTGSFAVIKTLQVSPATAASTVGSPVDFAAAAIDPTGASVAGPIVGWSWWQTDASSNPLATPPPASTISAGVFTPGATGTFEVEAYSGTVVGTASVAVN